MFIKTIVKTDKKSGKRYDYYRLCEGYRIGNNVRHRTIVSLGKLEGIDSKEDKKFLADLIEVKIKGDRQLFAFDVKPGIEKLASLFAKRIIDENLMDVPTSTTLPNKQAQETSEYHNIDINSINHEEVR